jgi:hypothetical protein
MSEHKPNNHVVHAEEMPEEHPERHEHSDVSVRGIWITVGAVIVTTLVVMVVMYVVFFAYEGAQAAQDEADRRSAIKDTVVGPPEGIPRLQGIEGYNAETPSADNIRMERQNRAVVSGYGKTPDGRVTIPIQRAMDLALERNLFPARGTATNPTTGTTSTTQPAGGGHAGH